MHQKQNAQVECSASRAAWFDVRDSPLSLSVAMMVNILIGDLFKLGESKPGHQAEYTRENLEVHLPANIVLTPNIHN